MFLGRARVKSAVSPAPGYALNLVLLVVAVLVTSVVALLATAGRTLFVSATYTHRLAARQAAEAGLARAMARLEQNPEFTGRIEEELTHAGARFELDIQAAPGGAEVSINNLLGSAPLVLPQGSLPAHSAFLVVTGSSAGQKVTLKALVEEAEETMRLSLLGSRRVVLHDQASLRGIESFTNNVPHPAGVHSNLTTAGEAVRWRGSGPGHRLSATGAVTSSSPDAGSISLLPAGGVSVAGVRHNTPQRPHLNYDIREQVALRASSPGPVFPLTGSFTLGPGDHYYGASQTLQGDLVLSEGARLYVDGDLTINGSVQGVGTIAVTGFTSLKGDASVSTADGDYIALLSRRGVELTGFDGSAFMDALASTDATAAVQWPRARAAMQGVKDQATSNLSAWATEESDDTFDLSRADLGNADGAPRLLSEVLPAGPTADFLRRKFHQMRLFYHDAWNTIEGDPVSDPAPVDESNSASKLAHAQAVANDYLAGQLRHDRGGIADVVSSQDVGPGQFYPTVGDLPQAIQESLHRVVSAIQVESMDKLGTSFFKGFVYSNGPIFVANEVTVIGAIEAQGLAGLPDRIVGGETLRAGDLFMGPKTDLLYVSDLFRSNDPLGRSGMLKPRYVYEE